MEDNEKIDFSFGDLPPETSAEAAEREARKQSSDAAGQTASDTAAAGRDADAAAGGEAAGENAGAEPKAVFHTYRSAPAPAGFHTRSAGSGAGVARGSAVSADLRQRAEEEKEPPKAQAKRWLKAAIRAAVIALVGFALVTIALTARENRGDLDVRKYADATAVSVDGEDMTFADLSFYIMYEEMKVERQAEIYNPDNTRDYWNILMNGVYLSARVKDMVMGMAVHDRIFYNEAVRAGITLSEEEKKALENRRTDFWEDLYPSQTENLITSRDGINHVIYEIGLCEKYQQQLSIENNVSYDSYDWNGKNYEKLRDKEHTVKVNRDLWHRFHMGNNTLIHDGANFIQGPAKEKGDESLFDIFFKSRD